MSLEDAKTKVVILSRRYHITGKIAHFPDARLTDYMVEARPFIAVTEAEVKDHEGRQVLSTAFMNVHKDQIEIITPVDQISKI